MKAFVVDKYQKKGALRLANVPEPELRDDDVLIRVHATAVNLLDSKVRDGEFKLILPYRPPFVLGHDVAGIVVRTGFKITRFKVGDEVYARPRDHRIGTFAEFIAINETDVALKPKNISMEEAASIPLVGLTAWQALVEVGKVKPGQKVFIQAGSGGVGTFAIQLAKHLGATVATTTSTRNVELVKRLGADVVVDYKTHDFEKVLSGYDLVLNSQEPKTLEKSLRVVRAGRPAHFDFWSARPQFRQAAGVEPIPETGDVPPEPRCEEKSQNPWHTLFFPVHASAGAAVERDHFPDRIRRNPPDR
jgi:NADPH:quinone reductase-like Zn-dependent oxidoreductase